LQEESSRDPVGEQTFVEGGGEEDEGGQQGSKEGEEAATYSTETAVEAGAVVEVVVND